LLQQIAEHEQETTEKLKLVCDSTGHEFNLNDVHEDQEEIVYFVLQKLQEFLDIKKERKGKKFEPVRLTVTGAAGSGKSRVVHVLTNTFRRIFGRNDVVHICAPTGAAANNAGGQTLHRLAAVNPFKPNEDIKGKKKDNMIDCFRFALMLIMDERSMITCENLGAAEKHIATTAHCGNHENEDWGGIPFVIMVGDDYQLPPASNKDLNPFNILQESTKERVTGFNARSNGVEQYKKMTESVMHLSSIKRQDENDQAFLSLLQRIRLGKQTLHDARRILQLDIALLPAEERQKVESEAIYLFANKEPRDQHNLHCLSKECNNENPIAIIKSKISKRHSKEKTSSKHFKDDRTPQATVICRNATVCLCGRNIILE